MLLIWSIVVKAAVLRYATLLICYFEYIRDQPWRSIFEVLVELFSRRLELTTLFTLGKTSNVYLVINGSAKTFDAIARPLTSHRRWRPTITRMSHRFSLCITCLDLYPSSLCSSLLFLISLSPSPSLLIIR